MEAGFNFPRVTPFTFLSHNFVNAPLTPKAVVLQLV
jgi:hypothetical protein